MSDEPEAREHEDYRVRISPRQRLADLAQWYLADAGCGYFPVDRFPDGRCYRIAFLTPGDTHGNVRIYSSSYVRVHWWRNTEVEALPAEGTRLFASLEDALAFICLAWLDGEIGHALAIPVKEIKQPRHGYRTEE